MTCITIKYFKGYPELEAELLKYPTRARAERIRNLASIGLAMLRQQSLIGLPTYHDGQQAEKINNDSQATQQQDSLQAQQEVQKKSASSAAIKNLFGQV